MELPLEVLVIEAAIRRARPTIEIAQNDCILGPKNIPADSTVYPQLYPYKNHDK